MSANETDDVSSSRFQPRKPDTVKPIRFSIVINTDNRLDYLKRTLSGLQYLDYAHFEVCAVAGPTPDGTREYLATFGDALKLAFCEERNLSKSRNIGIALADGDVVVFIDDDSVPEAEWLSDLAKSYNDEMVGGVGGFVYDNTGVRFQARYVTVNRLAYPTDSNEPSPHLNFPFAANIPHLIGTNCSFRMSALKEIGGFDEEYEYFLDETDVCFRLIDSGYRIVQRHDAFVHHKFAPSHMRDERKIVRNWYPLIKNRVYFGLRNALAHHSVAEVVAAGEADAALWSRSVAYGEREGSYSPADVRRFQTEALAAVKDGHARGLKPANRLTTALIDRHHEPFRAYPLLGDPTARRTFCFVTQDYPPGQNGGIARYFAQFAKTLAAEGHHVHVLTKAHGSASVDYEEGVWVHRLNIRHFPLSDASPIAPLVVPGHIWSYTQTMLEEVRAINARRTVDVVYCPLWDCEPLGFVIDGQFPLIVALQTTMRFWLESQPLKRSDEHWMNTFGHPIVAMEEYILERAPLLHSISRAIARDIRKQYAAPIPDTKIHYAPLCLEDWSVGMSPPSSNHPQKLRLLFVGRLESRKGIDVLLDAIPAVLELFPDAILDIVGDDTIPKADGTTYKGAFLKRDLPASILSRIVFHGRAEEQELREFYRDCDIFIAPSRYESFGLVFLEALMFGKPVIGCDAGGGPEVVTDGETGYLVAPGDVDGLTKALVKLISNPELRAMMGNAARADYEGRFTVTALASDLTAAIDRYFGPKAKAIAA